MILRLLQPSKKTSGLKFTFDLKSGPYSENAYGYGGHFQKFTFSFFNFITTLKKKHVVEEFLGIQLHWTQALGCNYDLCWDGSNIGSNIGKCSWSRNKYDVGANFDCCEIGPNIDG